MIEVVHSATAASSDATATSDAARSDAATTDATASRAAGAGPPPSAPGRGGVGNCDRSPWPRVEATDDSAIGSAMTAGGESPPLARLGQGDFATNIEGDADGSVRAVAVTAASTAAPSFSDATPPMLSAKDIAADLRIKVNTVHEWHRSGFLPHGVNISPSEKRPVWRWTQNRYLPWRNRIIKRSARRCVGAGDSKFSSPHSGVSRASSATAG